MDRFKKQLLEIVENFQNDNPDGGKIHIAGNSKYNEEAVKILNSFAGIVIKAELVEISGREGKYIFVEIESVPKFKFSYDGGKNWS